MYIMYIFTICYNIYGGALGILLMSESNVCENVLQECVYNHYFLEYIWVIYVLAFPGKTSGCLVPVNLMTPILYCAMSSYLSLFCLECASYVLSTANMYVCLRLPKWAMPSSELRYLSSGCKKAAR